MPVCKLSSRWDQRALPLRMNEHLIHMWSFPFVELTSAQQALCSRGLTSVLTFPWTPHAVFFQAPAGLSYPKCSSSLYPVWPTHPISKSCILFKATSVASAIPMDLAFLWASLEQVVWPSCLSSPRILLVLKHKVPHPRNSISAEQTQPVGHHKRGVGQALKGRWWLV